MIYSPAVIEEARAVDEGKVGSEAGRRVLHLRREGLARVAMPDAHELGERRVIPHNHLVVFFVRKFAAVQQVDEGRFSRAGVAEHNHDALALGTPRNRLSVFYGAHKAHAALCWLKSGAGHGQLLQDDFWERAAVLHPQLRQRHGEGRGH